MTFAWPTTCLREPFYHCARAIFHQRCGIEIQEPYSEFAQALPSFEPGWRSAPRSSSTAARTQDELVKKDPTIKTGKTLEMWGGYHDAADFDRLIGHVRIPAVLLTLYEMFPKAFTDRQLNIPESGNGLPDLVDEARWGVDFWVRMQDVEDGGSARRGGSECRGDSHTRPRQESDLRLLEGPDQQPFAGGDCRPVVAAC